MRRLMRAGFLAACGLIAGCSGNDTKDWLAVRCLDEPDPGPCRGHLYRYYYDYAADRCKAFTYGGCKGHVPFETRQACVSLCESGSRAEASAPSLASRGD